MDTRILIVDDSMSDMAVIKSMLGDYQLLAATNGLEAMKLVEQDPSIDLMVLDLAPGIRTGLKEKRFRSAAD
jgi:putative two-component system response regulator